MKIAIFQQEINDWDKNAEFYRHENEMPFQKIVRQNIYRFYDLKKHDRVLEAGGGVIEVDENTTLLDFSPKMIARAKMLNSADRKIIRASTHELPFTDESFDVVVANGLFHHLKAQGLLEKSTQEFFRVLKPGGKLCVFDRANNLLPNLFFYLRKPLKLIYRPSSQCCTSNELPFLEKDIKKIQANGFSLEKRKYLVALPFQLLIIFTNVVQYIFGHQSARALQKFLVPLGQSLEKLFSFKLFCAEQCLILRKK